MILGRRLPITRLPKERGRCGDCRGGVSRVLTVSGGSREGGVSEVTCLPHV